MKKPIEVVPYNSNWTQIFEVESNAIKEALGHNCIEVHHIGSTSVLGLSSKPIIDILPVVQDILKVDAHKASMEALGYRSMGEHGIPFRRYFQKGENIRTHNIHVYERGNPEIARHIRFRDWLREHPEDLKNYASLKQNLAIRFPNDIFSYCIGKEEFIADIEKRSKWSGLRFVRALTKREWDAAQHFRQKYFFSPHGIVDPYTWTFESKEHAHLILYQGVEIIGYAHIQLWPKNRAAMRIIVIEEVKRNQHFGSQFLTLCEKWLKSLGIKSLQAESRPTSIRFYTKNGYVLTPFDDPHGHESDPQDIGVGKML